MTGDRAVPDITASHAPAFGVTPAADPHCRLTHSKEPYLNGGWTHLQADAAMLCNQRGKGTFRSVSDWLSEPERCSALGANRLRALVLNDRSRQ
ncbi:hypothetical protein, partial [Streptomyces sp. NPDC052107]|uniref:hypothetical protein n=1 Tax=Streptomyces sp. NPDC052107 TaxID=3155632 RepID=UPI0034322786